MVDGQHRSRPDRLSLLAIGSDREQVGIFTGANIDRPSYVTSANATSQAGAIPYDHGSVIVGSPNEWYNRNMFTLQPTGTIGTVGRNSLTGPGLATWDFSLNKDTHASALVWRTRRAAIPRRSLQLAEQSEFRPAKCDRLLRHRGRFRGEAARNGGRDFHHLNRSARTSVLAEGNLLGLRRTNYKESEHGRA